MSKQCMSLQSGELPALMTIRQVADYLNNHVRTIEKRVREGEIKAVDISSPGSKRPTWRIPREELLALIAPEADLKSPTLDSFVEHVISNFGAISANSVDRLSRAIADHSQSLEGVAK